MIVQPSQSFADALHASGPAPELAEKLALYGRFVGAWDMDVTAYEPSGTSHHARGEIDFGWVLEGRAVQDVWRIPRRDGAPEFYAGNWYGTTLRLYDARIDAWHILWNDPARGFYSRQIGRARGADIVQEGKHDSGAVLRWSFSEITERSFHWRGEVSEDDGATFRRHVDIDARRRAA